MSELHIADRYTQDVKELEEAEAAWKALVAPLIDDAPKLRSWREVSFQGNLSTGGYLESLTKVSIPLSRTYPTAQQLYTARERCNTALQRVRGTISAMSNEQKKLFNLSIAT